MRLRELESFFFVQARWGSGQGSRIIRPSSLTPTLNPPDRRGEMVDIVGHGYRSFGFYGEHSLFHTREDGANATSPQLLETAAVPTLRAVATLLASELARNGDGLALLEGTPSNSASHSPWGRALLPLLVFLVFLSAPLVHAALHPAQQDAAPCSAPCALRGSARRRIELV